MIMSAFASRNFDFIVALWSAGAAFSAAVAADCWVDLYDKPEFAGSHVRIEGPRNLANLNNLNGENWSNRIESLAVGPRGEVVAYKQQDYNEEHSGQLNHPDALQAWGQKEMPALHELEITFGPGKKEHHLGELRFHQNINSLKLQCR
jgi:hypothetical protein